MSTFTGKYLTRCSSRFFIFGSSEFDIDIYNNMSLLGVVWVIGIQTISIFSYLSSHYILCCYFSFLYSCVGVPNNLQILYGYNIIYHTLKKYKNNKHNMDAIILLNRQINGNGKSPP